MIRCRKPLKRSAPLRRKAPLKRSKPPKRKRSTPRRSARVRDPEYLQIVRGLACCAPPPMRPSDPAHFMNISREEWNRHEGPVEADHAGQRPVGRKADDSTAIPMCRRHHRMRTDYSGCFAGWDAARMRAWCDQQIAATRLLAADRRAHATTVAAGVGGMPF